MWTAKVYQKTIKDGRLIVNVQFKNGADSFQQDFDLTGEDKSGVDTRILSRLKELDAAEVLNAKILTGDFVPDAKPDTSAEDAFVSLVVALNQAKRAVDLGVIPVGDPLYQEALAAVKAAFKPRYLHRIFG